MACNELFQYSIVSALMDGVASKGLPVAELLSHGGHGLGTFRFMVGEMIILDGELYQMKSDGTVTPIDPSSSSSSSDVIAPFAQVTRFEATTTTRTTLASKEEVSDVLTRLLPASKNHFAAVRLDGVFGSVTVRTASGQTEPRQSMREVGRNQVSHTFEAVEGTVVGFRSPSFVEGIGVPGIHLHFITADRKRGGHVLAIETGSNEVLVQVAELTKMHLELPVGDDEFDTAPLQTDAAGVAAVEG